LALQHRSLNFVGGPQSVLECGPPPLRGFHNVHHQSGCPRQVGTSRSGEGGHPCASSQSSQSSHRCRFVASPPGLHRAVQYSLNASQKPRSVYGGSVISLGRAYVAVETHAPEHGVLQLRSCLQAPFGMSGVPRQGQGLPRRRCGRGVRVGGGSPGYAPPAGAPRSHLGKEIEEANYFFHSRQRIVTAYRGIGLS
jgi:hypothetical protein